MLLIHIHATTCLIHRVQNKKYKRRKEQNEESVRGMSFHFSILTTVKTHENTSLDLTLMSWLT